MNANTGAKKSLKYFMREDTKTEPIVTAPGPASIPGEDGKPIMLEIKVLHNATTKKINDAYTTRSIATDEKGNPLIVNGEVVFKTERDSHAASMHILVEALVYPDLKDKDLMAFYNCHDITEMPFKVFPRSDEFSHVNRAVLAALGKASEANQPSDKEEIDDIKN